MSGELLRGRDLSGWHDLRADVIICGAGAGGSMAARELSRSGLSVLLLEEGDDHAPGSFTQREEEMFPRLYQAMGGQRTDDLSVLVMSGRGLGGSTVHNPNLCKRIPDPILDRWRDSLGIEGVGAEDMEPLFAEVERDLGVVPIPDKHVNAHNQVIQRGTEALGYRGARLSHNRGDWCIGSGFCEIGCAYDAKLNARRVLIPQALEAGANIYTDCRVDRVEHNGRVASGVTATLLDADGQPHGTLKAHARAICLAGSAIGSAGLALRSGLPDPHERLGRGLHIHPSSVVAGRFDEKVEAWRGVPQSYECTEFLDLRPDSNRRVWLVPSFAHPIGTASLMTGFGPGLTMQMRAYPHLAVLAAVVHDETEGRVYLDGSRTRIAYEATRADREQLALGVREGARILLAAGAKYCSVPAIPEITIRSEGDLGLVQAARFQPHDARLMAAHPMGSMPMGSDPTRSVTDHRGAHHQLRRLWVVDGSLFPTSIGGPPQIGIYTFGMKVARHLIEELADS